MVSPLNWGLGHATRCVPVIKGLLKRDIDVVIGADNAAMALLESLFPDIPSICIPGYEIQYPENGRMGIHIMRSLPGILAGIGNEHRQLDQLIREHGFEAVISDNRFGLRQRSVPRIYITHQVMIKAPDNMPFLEPVLLKLHRNYIRKFDTCWIPDFPGDYNLSGDLGHKYTTGIKTRFIGPLSRFELDDGNGFSNGMMLDLLVIISGPEPQRSVFEKQVLDQLILLDIEAVVVRGKPEEKDVFYLNKNVKVYPHLESDKLKNYILNSKCILCRPGYSSIMDLHSLKRKAFFIPTPGQTEQEYLAKHLSRQGFNYTHQNIFDIKEIIKKNTRQDWEHDIDKENLLGQALDDLINNI